MSEYTEVEAPHPMTVQLLMDLFALIPEQNEGFIMKLDFDSPQQMKHFLYNFEKLKDSFEEQLTTGWEMFLLGARMTKFIANEEKLTIDVYKDSAQSVN